jgi:hypothetical protein
MECIILSLCAYIVIPFDRFCQLVNCSERARFFATLPFFLQIYLQIDITSNTENAEADRRRLQQSNQTRQPAGLANG